MTVRKLVKKPHRRVVDVVASENPRSLFPTWPENTTPPGRSANPAAASRTTVHQLQLRVHR